MGEVWSKPLASSRRLDLLVAEALSRFALLHSSCRETSRGEVVDGARAKNAVRRSLQKLRSNHPMSRVIPEQCSGTVKSLFGRATKLSFPKKPPTETWALPQETIRPKLEKSDLFPPGPGPRALRPPPRFSTPGHGAELLFFAPG